MAGQSEGSENQAMSFYRSINEPVPGLFYDNSGLRQNEDFIHRSQVPEQSQATTSAVASTANFLISNSTISVPAHVNSASEASTSSSTNLLPPDFLSQFISPLRMTTDVVSLSPVKLPVESGTNPLVDFAQIGGIIGRSKFDSSHALPHSESAPSGGASAPSIHSYSLATFTEINAGSSESNGAMQQHQPTTGSFVMFAGEQPESSQTRLIPIVSKPDGAIPTISLASSSSSSILTSSAVQEGNTTTVGTAGDAQSGAAQQYLLIQDGNGRMLCFPLVFCNGQTGIEIPVDQISSVLPAVAGMFGADAEKNENPNVAEIGAEGGQRVESSSYPGGTIYDENPDAEDANLSPEKENFDSSFASKHKALFASKSQEKEKIFECNHCDYKSTRPYLIRRHLQTHCQERPHVCQICGRAFKTQNCLQNHTNVHRGVKNYKCQNCEACFATSGELARHNRYKHTLERPHVCDICGYATVEHSKLRRHMRSHTGEKPVKPYKCECCDYESSDTYKLKRHMRVHTKAKPYECDVCLLRFTQSNSLKEHKRTQHSLEKPAFPCPHCPSKCSRKTDLKIHIKNLHTSKAPLECKKCPQVFMDRYSLRCHIRDEHKPIRFYKCTFKCGFATDDKSAFMQHELRHSKTEPFRCEFLGCKRAFRTFIALKQHKRLAHKSTLDSKGGCSLVCTKCHQSFKNSINYQRHVDTHLRRSKVRNHGAASAGASAAADDDGETESLPELESQANSSSESSRPRSHTHNLRKRSFNIILNLRNFGRRKFGLDEEEPEESIAEEVIHPSRKSTGGGKKRNGGNTSRRKKRAPQKLPLPSDANEDSNQLSQNALPEEEAVESEQIQE